MMLNDKTVALGVDDDDDVLLILELMLGDEVELRKARSLSSAMSQVDGVKVVFADLRCGVTNGIDVIRECRQRLGPLAKIYLMSGDARRAEVAAAMTAGADGFIRKPFGSRELVEAMRPKLVDTRTPNGGVESREV